MSSDQETPTPAVALDLPQPATTLAPDEVVQQLRAMRTQISEVTPSTAAQRKVLRDRIRTSDPILQASINIIGALDIVEHAVGQPADDMRQLYDEANRWTAAEDEIRTMLMASPERTSSAASVWR